ncbi:ABC transporter permease [Agrobacterium pusense]|uniref:ABC transporter permease n=1 Tax=Agrobacterium pusense TaxID=648995 RepID=A0AA44IWY9_9HYPH|nr:ABC transporter permease [Agrobacterium pusense]MDH0873174.1 ABC transporter permease [Agrobacterium pusense]NRF07228.1 ABC transporter permease [Agrobacterium pusense]NRF17782.1 ABC transporter permease [Agrobacterium pusense]PZU77874.1 MAG: ABC transporter permease [Rhizobium sp.]
MRFNPWILFGRIWLGIAYTFMFLPLIVLVLFSVQKNRFPGFPLQGFTLQWYNKLFADGNLIAALGHTMIISPAAATVATGIAFLAAYAINRFDFRGKSLLLGVSTLPILIPPLILGVGFLGLLSRVHLSGSLFAVFLTHVVLVVAPALAIIQLRLAQMPASLEEAAWDLGATELQTVKKVVVPFAAPGIFGAWLLAFTFSFDEFIIAWFVSGFQPTLPVAIYSVLVASIDPSLNAIGTIVFAISCIVLVALELLLLPYLARGRQGS